MPAKILLVDDEASIVKIVRKQLEISGFAVSTATDGQAGLAMAGEIRPDLVLLDVMMPKMNGYQVCAALKQDPALRHIPVLLLTARAQRQDYQEGLKHGADGYLTKPFELDELLGKIRELLDRAAGLAKPEGSGEQPAS
jgi:two-component system response regulator RpaA